MHERAIAEHFAIEFEGEPEPGDRVPLGPATLVARAVEDGRVTECTLEVEDEPTAASPRGPQAWLSPIRRAIAGFFGSRV
jgi:hypothetical protein